MNILKYFGDELKNDIIKKINEFRKRKIAYIDGKPHEIGPNHTSILKFVKAI